jgi:hypothetical protein
MPAGKKKEEDGVEVMILLTLGLTSVWRNIE